MIALMLEGLLLLAILAVASDTDFEISFWHCFKVGLLTLATKILAIVLAMICLVFLPPPVALIAGVVLAGAALGWFISRQYQIDPKKAGVGVAVYIVFVITFNILFSSGAQEGENLQRPTSASDLTPTSAQSL